MSETKNKQDDAMAASAIAEADVLLLITGAGFSADSGLAVYNDVGKIEAYQLRNLDYCDVAQPKWIEKDPALFYGFYGQSFNDYRNTQPHDGYQILQGWRDDINEKTVASEIRSKLQHKYQLLRPFDDDDTRVLTPYKVDHEDPSQIAGAFYAYTSNVDAHHYDFFGAHEIHDCHGNIELWQCSDRDCESGIWRAPMDHKFVVDKEWMVAPEQKIEPSLNKNSSIEEKKDEGNSEGGGSGPAKIGQTKTTGKREIPLQYMPPSLDQKGWKDVGPLGNWAKCGHCGSLARPAVLMFGDFGFKYDVAQYKRWELWMAAVMGLVERKNEKEGVKMKACILEIGCGMNVPTCRNLSETIVEKVVSRGGDPTLIRINPDFPDAPKDSVSENHIISIPSRGLEAIRRIDEVYRTLKQES